MSSISFLFSAVFNGVSRSVVAAKRNDLHYLEIYSAIQMTIATGRINLCHALSD
jgi:hypothetical protein